MVRWIVLIFLGGSINSWALILVVPHLSQIIDLFWMSANIQEASVHISQLFLYGFPLILLPVFLSFTFTRILPKKRIVSPLHIQMITFGWFLFWHTQQSSFSSSTASEFLIPLYLIILYTIIGGLLQDRLLIRIIGITALDEDMEQFSLQTKIKKEKLFSIFLTRRFRDRLSLSSKPDFVNDSIKLFSYKTQQIQFVMELSDDDVSDNTIISVVVYKKVMYSLSKSESVEEHAISIRGDIENILSRQIPPILVTETSTLQSQSLAMSILQKFEGAPSQWRLTKLSWIKIVMFIGALGVTGILFLHQEDITNGIISLSIIFLYLAFELPSKFSKKNN